MLRKKYSGVVGERFGPTLASEHLAREDQVEVHAETLRRWMLAEGLWSRARKRKEHRERRQARAHFGELVQMDGSFHILYAASEPPTFRLFFIYFRRSVILPLLYAHGRVNLYL